MTTLIFQGIRCFYTRHVCDITPLTFLVGENSTGKSTFLAIARIAWHMVKGNVSEDPFNEDPFHLGAFDQVASLRGGRAGREKLVTIGKKFQIRVSPRSVALGFDSNITILGTYVYFQGRTALTKWSLESGKVNINITISLESQKVEVDLTTPDFKKTFDNDFQPYLPMGLLPLLTALPYIYTAESVQKRKTSESDANTTDTSLIATVEELASITSSIQRANGDHPIAGAPIRTKPSRTYDLLNSSGDDPEGSHVPAILSRNAYEETKLNQQLASAFAEFGNDSGLYDEVKVVRKGQKLSDPFQIGIRQATKTFNIVDVGYGVSQSLPILVDSVQSPKQSLILLQQPEVHLHPRAQAALGSFLVPLVTSPASRKQFIIETHSDYLIDRVRVLVRKKEIPPEMVSILHFHRNGMEIDIHHIKIDSEGGIVDAPSEYRQFFLNEERQYLGLD